MVGVKPEDLKELYTALLFKDPLTSQQYKLAANVVKEMYNQQIPKVDSGYPIDPLADNLY